MWVVSLCHFQKIIITQCTKKVFGQTVDGCQRTVDWKITHVDCIHVKIWGYFLDFQWGQSELTMKSRTRTIDCFPKHTVMAEKNSQNSKQKNTHAQSGKLDPSSMHSRNCFERKNISLVSNLINQNLFQKSHFPSKYNHMTTHRGLAVARVDLTQTSTR